MKNAQTAGGIRGTKGFQQLRDGDNFGEPCPHCDALLRVHRVKKGPIKIWCPCGYTDNAKDFY